MDHRQALSLTSCKSWLPSLAIVAGFLMFPAARLVHAETPEHCQQRIEHAEHDLHEAIEHHGRHSRQANHERRELRQARDRCWRENHRWWDYHERRWRQERDWDDRDHDRD